MSRRRSDTRSAIRALIRAVHGLTVAQQAHTKALYTLTKLLTHHPHQELPPDAEQLAYIERFYAEQNHV